MAGRGLAVLHRHGLVDVLPFDPLRRHRARRNGGAAPEGLELALRDVPVLVHFDLELHHVAARGCAHEPRADVVLLRVHRTCAAPRREGRVSGE